MEILEWSTLQKEIRTSPLLIAAADWKSSNTKACAKQLPQVIANNIDNGWRGVSKLM